MLLKNKKRYPLITRIVSYTFVFALLVSLLMLAGQIYFSYSLQKQRIENYLVKLEDTQLDTLINNVWSLDQGAIEIQLNSILGDPDIAYIWLQYEPDYVNIQEFGVKPAADVRVLTKEYELSRHSPEGDKVLIGRIGFTATLDNISNRLLIESSGSLLASLMTIIVVCLFILFLFITLYSRHINRIVNYTEELDVGQLDRKLVLKRTKRVSHGGADEIDLIVEALNGMRVRLKNEMQAQYLAKKELAQEKLFSDGIINSMPGIFFVLDDCLNMVRINNSFIDFLGGEESVTGKYDFFSSVPAEQKIELESIFKNLFESKESIAQEISLIGAVGSRSVPFLLTAQVLEIMDIKYLVGIGSNLTERKRMEARLRQAQKMEALGTLAGGISHDFNNILSAVVGYTSLAKLEYEGDGKLRKYLDTIEEASERAKALVQQILAFSRKTEVTREPVKVADIVAEVMTLLESSLPSMIQIKQTIESDLYAVVDSTEIHQIIMNLCTNGYHAMQKDGGTLFVSLTESVVSKDDSFPELNIAEGRYLLLEVSDTGMGMDDDTRSKIFEPYFTTKDTGAGTGLGLSVVHGVVSSYNGYIYVYSVPGKGTSFTIYLPAVIESSAEGGELSDSLSQNIFQAQGEKVLVIDDEQFILDYFDDILSRYGYQVTSFHSSGEALSHFEDNTKEYDLAIVDQIMPEIQGDKLAEKMWEVHPNMPIILCSGFSGALGRREFLEKGFRAYMQKPINVSELLQTISDVLNHQGVG